MNHTRFSDASGEVNVMDEARSRRGELTEGVEVDLSSNKEHGEERRNEHVFSTERLRVD